MVLGAAARFVRRSDDHYVVGHHRRGMQPDFAGDEIHFLVVVELQIDDAVVAEARDRIAGFGVQSHQTVADGDI